MKTALILAAVVAVTLVGDYLIKLASQKPAGLTTWVFFAGAFLYGLPAVGWYFMMKSHSLAAIGVFYSAATIIILAALGFFIFKEPFGLRESIGLGLAILAVIAVNH